MSFAPGSAAGAGQSSGGGQGSSGSPLPQWSSQQSSFNITPYLNFPAGTPPPGVVPNYANPKHYIAAPIAGSGILVALMLFFLVCRFYSKYVFVRKLFWDDLACCLGALGAIVVYVALIWVTCVGTFGVHQWDQTVGEMASDVNFEGGLILFTGQTLASTFSKVACLIMYWTIFNQLRWMRITLLTGGIVFSLANLALNIANTYLYAPRPGEGWLQHTLNQAAQKSPSVDIVPVAALSLVTDIFILLIPIPAVWGLHMPRKRRFAVLLVFMAGSLACVASALNLAYRVDLITTTDLSYDFVRVYTVGVAEYTIGVVCACAPSAFHVFRNFHPFGLMRSMQSRARTNGTQSTAASAQTQRTGASTLLSTPGVLNANGTIDETMNQKTPVKAAAAEVTTEPVHDPSTLEKGP